MGQMYKAEVQCWSVDTAEGFLVSGTLRLCAHRNQNSADIPVAGKWTFPNVPLCGCRWISPLSLNTRMRNRGDNISLFTVAPLKASAPGWKITGNCWSHWIQFGFGWKTKKTKLWLLKRQGQGAWRPCCEELIWYIFLPLEMSEVLARDGKKKKKSEREGETPALPANTIHLPYYI